MKRKMKISFTDSKAILQSSFLSTFIERYGVRAELLRARVTESGWEIILSVQNIQATISPDSITNDTFDDGRFVDFISSFGVTVEST